jgi:hypothetical protein
MVSAWLVSSGYCTSTSEAMQVVGKMLQPLDYPSQIRFLKYYGKSLKSGVPQKDRFIFLHKIRFNTIPNFKFTGGCGTCPVSCRVVLTRCRSLLLHLPAGQEDLLFQETGQYLARDWHVTATDT